MSASQPPATSLIAPSNARIGTETRARAPMTVMAGLWVMGIFELYTGLQQQFLPQRFYDQFPGFDMTWVSTDGPFNEHLLRDLGGANLAIAFLIFLAIARPTAYLVRGVAIAMLISQVPHFVYHALHLELLPNTLERVLQTASLGLVLLVPILVLAASHDLEGHASDRQ